MTGRVARAEHRRQRVLGDPDARAEDRIVTETVRAAPRQVTDPLLERRVVEAGASCE